MYSAVAHASSITFDLVNVNSSAGTLTGTVDIDSATKLVTSAQITLNDIAAGGPVFNSLSSQATHNGVVQSFVLGASNDPLNEGGKLELYYDITSFGTGSGILNICLQGVDCGYRGTVASDVLLFGGNGTQGPVYLTSGELDPDSLSNPDPAPAAEPPSLLLLGTGIVSIALLMARMAGRRANSETTA
jgi:hypothetical protein